MCPGVGARRRPALRRARFVFVAALSGLALAGCARQGVAAPPLRTRGTVLPTHAGPVRLTQAPYSGPDRALYRSAARYFRWPLLVPAAAPAGARATGATISRFFAGSFTVDPNGQASQVPASYVAGNSVAPAAYQLRVTYVGKQGFVTLFEAVHAYAPPKGARALRLPGGLVGGRTWQSAPSPGAAPLRYVEGRAEGLYLMAYGAAKGDSAGALAAYFSALRSVAVPLGRAPLATQAGNAFPVVKAKGGHGG